MLAFLHLDRDSPNLSVLGLPMFAAFWDGQLPQIPVPWWLFQGVACAIALPELHKSLSLGETFYSCNIWEADLVWKLGREKASICSKVWPLVVGHMQGLGCSRTRRPVQPLVLPRGQQVPRMAEFPQAFSKIW